MNIISFVLWALMAAQGVTTTAACSKGMICLQDAIPPPMDVPAIRVKQMIEDFPLATENCRNAKISGCVECVPVQLCDLKKHVEYHYTCADKSRILLTAEDGTRHCVKFGGK